MCVLIKILFIMSPFLFSHTYGGITNSFISSPVLYDYKHKNFTIGFDYNLYVFCLNAGVNYKYQSYSEELQSNELALFLGTGFGPYFQTQLGYTTSGLFILRLRNDFSIIKLSEKRSISISPIVEFTLNSKKRGILFGISIGICGND